MSLSIKNITLQSINKDKRIKLEENVKNVWMINDMWIVVGFCHVNNWKWKVKNCLLALLYRWIIGGLCM